MVFQCEAQFQQFIHCKFRENIVRAVYVPTLQKSHVFLIVNKYGKVGLYESDRVTLVHTYLLDLSMPTESELARRMSYIVKRQIEFPQPKCQRTHLVVDAVFAPDLQSVFYLTTKGILQGYDIGEIEKQKYGIELLPKKSFGKLTRQAPTELRNFGHVETHRISGLPRFPTCMEYNPGNNVNGHAADQSPSMLLIGDSDGCVTIIMIPDTKNPFGYRKIRGILHQMKIQELEALGHVNIYSAHKKPITELRFLSQRQLIISASRDKKSSVYIKDLTGVLKPAIISTSKGINTFAYSESLKVIATGSDDQIIRLVNQFVPTMTQMELQGHRASILSLQFLQVPFSREPILLSLSTDVELRAWNPTTYVCLQSVYISFPIKSNIFCKTPEFAHRPVFVQQASFLNEVKINQDKVNEEDATSAAFEGEKKQQQGSRVLGVKAKKGQDGFLLILYCNSYAKLWIEKEPSYWPFDFEELASEFDALSVKYEQKLQKRQTSKYQNLKDHFSLSLEELDEVESKLQSYVAEVMGIRRRVEQELGKQVSMSRVKPIGTSLSGQVTQYCHLLKNDREKSRLLQEGGAFKVMPIFDLQPLRVTPPSSNGWNGILPGTDMMKASGLVEVTSSDDLVTPLAKKCFSPENMHRMRIETSVAKLDHFQLGSQASSSADESSKVKVLVTSSDEEKSEIEFKNNLKSKTLRRNNFDFSISAPDELSDSSSSSSDLVNDDDYLRKSLEKLMNFTSQDYEESKNN